MEQKSLPNEITDLTRRAIVDYLLSHYIPFYGRLDLVAFLRRIWNLSEMASEDERHSDAEGDIWQHMINNHDWDDDRLLYKRLHIETCDDSIFLHFLEECLNPRVVTDMETIGETAEALNHFLIRDGYRLVEAEQISGWPLYRPERTPAQVSLPRKPADAFPVEVTYLTQTMIDLLMNRGQAREVALLTFAGGHSLERTGYDIWNGGVYFWTLGFQTPTHVYARLSKEEVQDAERQLGETVNELLRPYESCRVETVVISPVVNARLDIHEQALRWLNGEGITNQGRVRSDNIASREDDGLLFRSTNEILLYRALKAAGVLFAPLPVYLRGGKQYSRLEPDFVIFKDNVILVVEVDGDTVHRESPAAAEQRLRVFTDEGALTHRILASQCKTDEQAQKCVIDLLDRIERHVRRR